VLDPLFMNRIWEPPRSRQLEQQYFVQGLCAKNKHDVGMPTYRATYIPGRFNRLRQASLASATGGSPIALWCIY